MNNIGEFTKNFFNDIQIAKGFEESYVNEQIVYFNELSKNVAKILEGINPKLKELNNLLIFEIFQEELLKQDSPILFNFILSYTENKFNQESKTFFNYCLNDEYLIKANSFANYQDIFLKNFNAESNISFNNNILDSFEGMEREKIFYGIENLKNTLEIKREEKFLEMRNIYVDNYQISKEEYDSAAWRAMYIIMLHYFTKNEDKYIANHIKENSLKYLGQSNNFLNFLKSIYPIISNDINFFKHSDEYKYQLLKNNKIINGILEENLKSIIEEQKRKDSIDMLAEQFNKKDAIDFDLNEYNKNVLGYINEKYKKEGFIYKVKKLLGFKK